MRTLEPSRRYLIALFLAAPSLALSACGEDDAESVGDHAGSAGHSSSNGGAGGAWMNGAGVTGNPASGEGGASDPEPTVSGRAGSAGASASAGRAGGGGRAGAGGAPPAGAGNDGLDAGMGGQGPAAGAGQEHWQPQAGLTWQWQLSAPVRNILDVDVYDIDWESDSSTVDALHAKGIRVICYVSVGSWEDFRPDAEAFSASVIGNDYDGWPGEKYLDIRSAEVRARMLDRFDTCRSKGFDAIEPDNMDVFELGADSGFPLTRADGVEYAKWLADAAHQRGLGIGQKNASSITSDIEGLYDWALTESCYSDGDWCDEMKAYPAHEKPVFMCEYEEASFPDACAAWRAQGYSPILKDLELGAAVTSCP